MDAKKTAFLRKRERRWELHRRFEKEYKSAFLKKLSFHEGLRIWKELYETFCVSGYQPSRRQEIERLHVLARVHALFGKVKP